MAEPELDFRAELERTIRECKRFGYNPSGLSAMLASSSAFDAARTLLAKRSPSDGFGRLWEKGRLDLSIEAVVLKPAWREFFAASEIAAARARLMEVGYRAPWDGGQGSA